MTTWKWIIVAYLALNVVLALIPGLQAAVESATASFGGTWTIVLRFLFDPVEYVWKWIVGLLVVIVVLFIK